MSCECNFTSKTDSPRVDLGKGLPKSFAAMTGGRVGGPQDHGQAMFEWLDLAIWPLLEAKERMFLQKLSFIKELANF